MFITTPNTVGGKVFRRHRMQHQCGREIRPGNDYLCLTGYHRLTHRTELREDTAPPHDYTGADIAVAPLDAPDFIPAGGCSRSEHASSKKVFCNQAYVWRE